MLQSLFISLPMVVCAVITVELALEWLRGGNRAIRMLLLWAATATLLYACHYLFFHHTYSLLPYSDTVYTACNLAVYPLYLLYISELADTRPLLSQPVKSIILLAPAAIGALACGIAYAMMSPEETGKFITTYLYCGHHPGLHGRPLTQAIIHDICHVLFSVQVIVVMIFGVRKVRDYNKKLNLLFADTERRSLHWVNNVLVLLVATSFLSLIANEIGRSRFADTLWVALPSTAFTSVLFVIGWLGMHKRPAAKELLEELDLKEMNVPQEKKENDEEESNTAEKNTDNEGKGMTSLIARATALIEGEKLYLQNDLKLDDVATLLGTNRTYLIYALNEGKGMPFKEYINRLRIAHAKKLMADSPNMPKSEVATLCGYSTPSSFYRNWKRYESS